MEFLITASSSNNSNIVLNKYPELLDFGFEFGPPADPGRFQKAYIEINTLEDLIRLMEETGEPVILAIDNRHGYDKRSIEIYDCCREEA